MNMLYSLWGLRKLLLITQNLLFNAVYGKIFKAKVKIFGLPVISITEFSRIKVGRNLTLISSSYFSGPGINHPVIIRSLRSDATLEIGENVGISGGGYVRQKK